MKLEQYLSEVFGENITVKKFEENNQIPLIIRNDYDFYEGELHGNHCIFMQLRSRRILTEKILKHFTKLSESIQGKFILIFDELRPYQRRNLVEKRIAFVVPDTQIYLPFVFVDFHENISLRKPKIEKFTPSIQCIYIAIFYQLTDEIIASNLSKRLGLSQVSVYRAISNLITLNLINEEGKATRKKFTRISKESFWIKGKEYLISPVQRTMHLISLPKDISYFISNESALSEMSMMNSPERRIYAIDKKDAKKIDKNILFSEIDNVIKSKNDAIYEFEVWSYNPKLFAKDNKVDVCSIYAELIGLADPRIEIELETLIEGEL